MKEYRLLIRDRITRLKNQLSKREDFGIISPGYDMFTSEISGKIKAYNQVLRETNWSTNSSLR